MKVYTILDNDNNLIATCLSYPCDINDTNIHIIEHDDIESCIIKSKKVYKRVNMTIPYKLYILCKECEINFASALINGYNMSNNGIILTSFTLKNGMNVCINKCEKYTKVNTTIPSDIYDDVKSKCLGFSRLLVSGICHQLSYKED